MEKLNQKAINSLIKNLSGQANILTIPRIYIDLVGDIKSALFLSQCVYWSDRSNNVDGWFYKSASEWFDEIHLTYKEIMRITLTLNNYLDTKVSRVNSAPTTHYRVKIDELTNAILTFCENKKMENSPKVSSDYDKRSISETDKRSISETDKRSISESDKRSVSIMTKGENLNSIDYTETTTEITKTETSSSSVPNDLDQAQEEEDQKFFSDCFVQKLIKAGVFDTKLNKAEQLAIQGGWTEKQLDQLLSKVCEDDKRGTPAALFLYRLEHLHAPTEKDYLPNDDSPEVGIFEPDEKAIQIWEKAKVELVKKINPTDYSIWFSNGAIDPWIDGSDFVLSIVNSLGISVIKKHTLEIEEILKLVFPEISNLIIE